MPRQYKFDCKHCEHYYERKCGECNDWIEEEKEDEKSVS